MSARTLMAVGECMVEFSGGDEGGAWRLGFAGDTLNVAWCARALLDPAAWRVSYLTRVGTDGFSDRMLAFLGAHGIATDAVSRDPDRRPGLYVIERQDGERSFTYWRERSAARGLADDEAALRGALSAADVVHLSGITLAILAPDRRAALLDAVAEARSKGALTSLDTNLRPALWEDAEAMREWIGRAAGAAEIVLPSFADEAAAFGDVDPGATADRYRALGAAEVAVKDGPHPALLDWPGAREAVPARPTQVVDSTGAGDAFAGAYLAARAEGLSPPDAARRGHLAASRAVAVTGALPPMDALRRATMADDA